MRRWFWRGPDLSGSRDARGREIPWQERELWPEGIRRSRQKWAEPNATPDGGRSLGVALSGGGSRAAAFALGALLYLVDSGLNRFVTAVTSVSGTSIPNAVIAHAGDFRTASRQTIRDQVLPIARTLAAGIVPQWLVRTYMAAIAIAVASGVFGLIVVHSLLRIAMPIGGVIVAAALIAARGIALEKLLGRRLPSERRSAEGFPWHVISATDLASGEQVHFTEPFARVYSATCVRGLARAVGASADIPLRRIVRSSCSVPGLLPPVRFSTEDINDCLLVDGGVSNNLATTWYEDVPGSLQWNTDAGVYAAPPTATSPDLLLAVDGGGAFQRQPLSTPRRMPPLVQEFFVVFRLMAILYHNTLQPRVRDIADRLLLEDLRNRQPWREVAGDAAYHLRSGLSGRTALASIEVGVAGLADAIRAQATHRDIESELKRRADVAALLPWTADDQDWWNIEEDHLEVPTTFGPLGGLTVARLIWHGYMNAMEASYLAFDGALIEPPSVADLAAVLGVKAAPPPRRPSLLGELTWSA